MMLLLLATPFAVLSLLLGWRLGVHQRLPLAFSRIRLEAIPDRAAARHGDRPLFTCDPPVRWRVGALAERYPDGSVWSAERIRTTAGWIAAALHERLRVPRGARVAILESNGFDMHVLMAGIVRAGAIACPMNGAFDAAEVGPFLVNIGARLLITDTATATRVLREGGSFGDIATIVIAEPRGPDGSAGGPLFASIGGCSIFWLEELLDQVKGPLPPCPRGAEDPVYLVHSSGTTGFPKAVILRNGAQSHAVRGWLCYVHLSRTRDRGYLAVPNNHQAVILTFNSLMLLGLPTHWIGSYGTAGFDAERVVHELADGGFTGFFGFPITYTQMKEVDLDRYDLGRMRFWATTADATHEVIARRFFSRGSAFRSVGIPMAGSVFLDAQGSSEVGTPSVLRYLSPLTRRFDRRVGRPGSTPLGPQLRIARDGVPVRRGEVGRLEVRGRTVFNGYWNNHALTYEAFRDRWFFTGDVARQERDGHIIQLDREVDVIHTREGAVYSLLIEERVHRHPAVFDACVYGARQEDGTQLPAAAIALRDGFEIEGSRLRDELNALLSGREQLARLDVMPWQEFPIGVTGKTLKRVFRERSEGRPVIEANRPSGMADPVAAR